MAKRKLLTFALHHRKIWSCSSVQTAWKFIHIERKMNSIKSFFFLTKHAMLCFDTVCRFGKLLFRRIWPHLSFHKKERINFKIKCSKVRSTFERQPFSSACCWVAVSLYVTNRAAIINAPSWLRYINVLFYQPTFPIRTAINFEGENSNLFGKIGTFSTIYLIVTNLLVD